MPLPADHPARRALNDEVHTRPPEALQAPLRLSFLALAGSPEIQARQWERIADLARRHGVAPPSPSANHFSCDLGPFRVKWERHTEFTRYKFIVSGAESEPFAEPAIAAVPKDWLESLEGETIVATNVAFVSAGTRTEPFDADAVSARYFGGNGLAGGGVAGGAAIAVTDFRIHADGFSRILVEDHSLRPRQVGRTIQRLLEIDTYRMMALLALPAARTLSAELGASEADLARTADALIDASPEDEAALLDRLTRLASEIESRFADKLFRFSASSAYYALVRRRIVELREERIDGLQTIDEFLERRLTPAMSTCEAVAARQASLSERVAHVSQLLSTRVQVTREKQTQELLASMDRRAKVQLRLQETVEGLSVAAVTYYLVGLVGYGAEGLKHLGLPFDSSVVKGISIPIIAFLVWMGVRRIRKQIGHEE